MEKEYYLSLQDVGDLIYRVTQIYLFRNNEDQGIDISIQTSPLQETLIMRLMDNSHILVKIFPHKNFSQTFVYRIEVYKTTEGEMRGTKIAFFEASKHDSSVTEIQKFVHSYLSQLGF
jgi:hypothetical protein